MNNIIKGLIDKARCLKHQGKFPLVFKAYQLIRVLLIHFKNSCRDLACFSSVTIRLPWSFAYYRMGERLGHKLLYVINSDDYQKEVADEIYYRACDFLERACQLRPNFVDAVQRMGWMAILTGRSDAWIKAQYRSIEYQEKCAEMAGVAQHNFRILKASPLFTNIGQVFELVAWIKAGILGLRPPWQSIILVEPELKKSIVNQCMLNYLKPYINFVEDPVELSRLKPLASDLRVHNDCYPYYCDKKFLPYTSSAGVWIQREWNKQGRQPLLQLEDKHREQGWQILEKMGIPKGAWFVTSHVREGGFKGKEGFRDSDISTYLGAYKEVTARGGWVIRMGDPSMTPLPPMPNVFDYALSSAKSDWMDIFLLAAARFMIGTSSGPIAVSLVFDVPIAMTNNLPTASTIFSRQDLFLPRLLRRLDDHRFLNLEEIMLQPYSLAFWDKIYTNVLGVETIPNTSEEISELVREMLNKLDGIQSYTEEEETLQQRFKSLTAEGEVMIGLPGFEIQCRLGNSFLHKYQHILG